MINIKNWYPWDYNDHRYFDSYIPGIFVVVGVLALAWFALLLSEVQFGFLLFFVCVGIEGLIYVFGSDQYPPRKKKRLPPGTLPPTKKKGSNRFPTLLLIPLLLLLTLSACGGGEKSGGIEAEREARKERLHDAVEGKDIPKSAQHVQDRIVTGSGDARNASRSSCSPQTDGQHATFVAKHWVMPKLESGALKDRTIDDLSWSVRGSKKFALFQYGKYSGRTSSGRDDNIAHYKRPVDLLLSYVKSHLSKDTYHADEVSRGDRLTLNAYQEWRILNDDEEVLRRLDIFEAALKEAMPHLQLEPAVVAEPLPCETS